MLVQIVGLIFTIINWLVRARILMSWLPMLGVRLDPYNPIVRFLIDSTDWLLEPFRRIIPPVANMDFSPIVAILVLNLVQNMVMGLLTSA
ncbi:MAG: YggT family protein [Anaerolineales bacterium]|nr:YggT family protein [Anaerolineales bacterium]MCB9128803.1 YggT family protein [Ardenticatenales bacterium]